MDSARFTLACWHEHEHEDFDKYDTWHWDVIEAATGEPFMRLSGSIDQPYGCDPEFDGVGLVCIDTTGEHVIVCRGSGRHYDFSLDPPERVKIERRRNLPPPTSAYLDHTVVFGGWRGMAEAAARLVSASR